jgi:hypothetical protein
MRNMGEDRWSLRAIGWSQGGKDGEMLGVGKCKSPGKKKVRGVWGGGGGARTET